MTCRHQPGDPNCGSHPDNVAARERESREEERVRERLQQITPDADNYEILDVEQVGSYLVMRVKYPNCTRCAYEGVKVMVSGRLNVDDVDDDYGVDLPKGGWDTIGGLVLDIAGEKSKKSGKN